MTTANLLRDVAFGRVPEDSLVRGHVWHRWRWVRQIREVCAFRRVQAQVQDGWQPLQSRKPPTPFEEGQDFANRFLRASTSPTESLLVALHAAVEATRAEYGMVHRFRPHRRAFVTCFTVGDGLEPWVDLELAGFDAACVAAVEGRGVWGSHGIGAAQRAIVSRLGQNLPLRGVAMVPIRSIGRTVAMLELGRSDHPFRACDKRRLAGVRSALEQRYHRDEWNPWCPKLTPP
ncbi:MAG: hypothetical protein CSA75_04170 [Sorangium cellulosum]|nr:MAG: hypothetical protein CSA75_04170 [Sorangium cellulosum]